MKEAVAKVGVEIGEKAGKADKGGAITGIKEIKVAKADGVVIKEVMGDGEATTKEEDGDNLIMEVIKEEADGEAKEAMGGEVEAIKGETMDGAIMEEVAETDGATIIVETVIMVGVIKVVINTISSIINSRVAGALVIMTVGEAAIKVAVTRATRMEVTVQGGAQDGDCARMFIINNVGSDK